MKKEQGRNKTFDDCSDKRLHNRTIIMFEQNVIFIGIRQPI